MEGESLLLIDTEGYFLNKEEQVMSLSFVIFVFHSNCEIAQRR